MSKWTKIVITLTGVRYKPSVPATHSSLIRDFLEKKKKKEDRLGVCFCVLAPVCHK